MARKQGDSGQAVVLDAHQIKRLAWKPQPVEPPPVLSYQTNMWFQLKTFLTSILLLIALCFGANAKQAGQETWIDIGAIVVEVGPGVVAAIKGGEFLGKLDFSKPLAKTQAPSVNPVSAGGKAAPKGGAGSLTDGTFAQVKAKPTKPFSSEGQAKYSELAGETIETVQDLTNAINTGKIKPADIQVDYVMINGQPVIANTRTSTALTNAGVPQSQWNGVNQTGQIQYGTQTFDQAVQNQINNNAGQPISPSDW